MKRVKIELGRRLYFLLISLVIVAGVLGLAYAYGGTQPSIHGHDAGELDLSGVDFGGNDNYHLNFHKGPFGIGEGRTLSYNCHSPDLTNSIVNLEKKPVACSVSDATDQHEGFRSLVEFNGDNCDFIMGACGGDNCDNVNLYVKCKLIPDEPIPELDSFVIA